MLPYARRLAVICTLCLGVISCANRYTAIPLIQPMPPESAPFMDALLSENVVMDTVSMLSVNMDTEISENIGEEVSQNETDSTSMVDSEPAEEEVAGGWRVPMLFDSVYVHYEQAQIALMAAQGHIDLALAYVDSIGEDGLDEDVRQSRDELIEELSPLVLALSMVQRQKETRSGNEEFQLVLNDEVRYEIQSFQGRERAWFIRSYRRSSRFLPIMRDVFKEHDIPDLMVWLPFIESGFSSTAHSHAGALGQWQFIASTGHRFGLARNSYVEERMNVRLSTEAAISFLTYLHEMFGDWQTALAAYNTGEGRVMRTIRRQRISYLDNFWDLFRQLPRETARYVPRFIAVQLIINDFEKYGFTELLDSTLQQTPVEEVAIARSIHLRDIAAELTGVTENELAALNPDLLARITPPKPYTLIVPQGGKARIESVLSRLPTETRPPPPPILTHRVRRGETLSTIARRYRTSVRSIMRENRIRNANRLSIGKRLRIPNARQRNSPAVTRRMSPSTQPAVNTNGVHVVRRGETLWAISQRYGMSLNQLRRANSMGRRSRIYPGQRLRIVTNSS